jgi:hypothetical protein
METAIDRTWPLLTGVEGRAVFSTDRRYRHRLERSWDRRLPTFTYVLLNPSRATDVDDDPTTRKLQHITSANGGGGYVLVNLFGSVDPLQTGLHLDAAAGEPLADVDRWIREALEPSRRTVVGWGAGNGAAAHSAARRQSILRRARAVWPILEQRELWCVSRNRDGSPRHPGRGVRNDAALRRYMRPDGYP